MRRRLAEVTALLIKYGFEFVAAQLGLAMPERGAFLRGLRPAKKDQKAPPAPLTAPIRLRLMLEELGATYIKLGQMLSSRSDLLPDELTSELARLQDHVPPFPFEQVRAVVERELGARVEDLFAAFEPEPLAAASLGQVHGARLPEGQKVVVKVRRPGVRARIEADTAAMMALAELADQRLPWARRLGAKALVEEFAYALSVELDYRNEASRCERLRRDMARFRGVNVPRIYWSHTARRVLTMERVEGVRIDDLEALDAAGIDRVELADRFIRSLLHQGLIEGFFHSDPHPGNVLINLETGELTFLDMGQMGYLSDLQRRSLSNLAVGLMRRDSVGLVQTALSLGAPTKPIDRARLQRDASRLLERYGSLPLKQISFGLVVAEVPGALALVAKTLIQGEEIARMLNPDLDMDAILRPIARQMVWQRFRPDYVFNDALHTLNELERLSRALPDVVDWLLRVAGDEQIKWGLALLESWPREFSVLVNRLAVGMLMSALLMSSALLIMADVGPDWLGMNVLGLAGLLTATVIGAMLTISILRSGLF